MSIQNNYFLDIDNENELVRCPNMCFNGLDKIHHQTIALYDFCTCKYCKGKGVVKKEDYAKIDALI